MSAQETIEIGGLGIRFLVRPEESAGSASVFECSVAAQARMPAPHSHDGFEETVYGLEGVLTFTVDGETIEVGPGEALCIARGAVHGFANPGAEDARFLAIATPGVMSPAYFREVRDVLADAAGGPPDLARVGAVMRRHGLTPAPPVTA
jgi:quercetin dioxygenase-like cupin family protein